MTTQEILKSKNTELMKKVLSDAGIYHGDLSESRLIENFEYYVKIGRIN